MNLTFLNGLALLAADQPKGPSILVFLIPLVLIFLLYQIVVVRPQKRDRQKLLSSVKKNDRVVTIGGIYGVVTNVHAEADEVTIKVDEATNTKIRLTLGSIARVLSEERSEEKSSPK